jgi:hypothetical protein
VSFEFGFELNFELVELSLGEFGFEVSLVFGFSTNKAEVSTTVSSSLNK